MAVALPAIYAATAVIGAGAALYGATRKPDIPKPDAPPEPPAPPAAPVIPDVAKVTAEDIRKKQGRKSTILTSPSGLSDTQSLTPTLLGQ
jgi:hypothetical protein